MKKLLVVPHSNDLAAVKATEHTFQQLAFGGSFERTDDGEYRKVDDKLVLCSNNPDFVKWAAMRQRYVKSIEIFEE